MGLGLVDVLPPWADLGQPQGLAGHVEPGLGRVECILGVVVELARDVAALQQVGAALEQDLGIGQGGAVGFDHGPVAGDLLRSAAGFQPAERDLLGFRAGPCQRRQVFVGLRLQQGDRLAGLHRVAFLAPQLLQPADGVEGEVDLPDIDVAVERQPVGRRPRPEMPSASRRRNHGHDADREHRPKPLGSFHCRTPTQTLPNYSASLRGRTRGGP